MAIRGETNEINEYKETFARMSGAAIELDDLTMTGDQPRPGPSEVT